MAKRRVRLNDENDPLSSTDKVLAGFEQVSKSTSQPDKKSTSQEDSNSTIQEADKPTSQEDDLSTSGQDKAQPLTSTSQSNNRRKKPTSQQDSNLTIQEADKLTSQEDDLSISGQDEAQSLTSTSQSNNQRKKSTSQKDSNLTIQEANKSTSQKSKSEKTICRKSTFQINSQVLDRLDKLHLTLQLELGKTNAPYKEVIVEEALVRLLEEINSDPGALIEALVERQKSRDKI